MKVNSGFLSGTIWLFTYVLIENSGMNTMTNYEGHSRSFKVNWKRKRIISKHSSNMFTFSLLMFKMSTLNMDT